MAFDSIDWPAMEILKTWLVVLGTLALGFVSLVLVQTKNTLALREVEIARLQAAVSKEAGERPAVTPVPVSVPASASPPEVQKAAVQALVAMTADRDRYKDGLYKCVEEVNRKARGSGRRFEIPAMPAAAAPSPGQPHISALYSEPTVTPLGDRLMVSGKLFNTGAAPGTVTAVVVLLRDGKQVSTQRLQVTVPAQGQSAWSTQFPWSSQEGSWTAIVTVE
jgi:hypothetical protein